MKELAIFFPVAESISRLFYPYAEVVVHDLKIGRIAAIYNNFSKRSVGDESLIEELEDISELPDIFPIYAKVGWDGKKLKSSTATLRDCKGKAIGLLCINLDLSKWEEMHELLGEWLKSADEKKQPKVLFKDDWREKINRYVAAYLKKEGVTLKALSKEKKRQLVAILHQEGAFHAKNGALYVADVLGLSRATIYNYLRR
jgi:predicted transcriptional regulator YheO